ncbi:MAG: hypothetical protein HC933_10330 [Pleurocapsa sp. SU_196_0]|nr:hypothetical protein [Pleurocapsa sp. SU_196_0]
MAVIALWTELALIGLAAYFCALIAYDTARARWKGVQRSRAWILGGVLGAVGLTGWLFAPERLHALVAPWGGLMAFGFALLTWAQGRKRG